MVRSPANRRLMAELLSMVSAIPAGRVASIDRIAEELAVQPNVVSRLLAGLTDDERQSVPWHRVVAKGGAIGFGPHKETQFARLVREGVPVSPAAIVQDMPHISISGPLGAALEQPIAGRPPAVQPPSPRWRGMREKPD